MDKYKEIFEFNKKWVAEKLQLDADYFTNHYNDHSPDFLYIGCSDSRVSVTTFTGLDIGDIFVHRNIANLVPNNDLNMLSILQYAIEVLNVKYVIICGHYGCGGVHSAMESKSYGLLDNWLRNIRDVYRIHAEELNKYEGEEKYDKLVEFNVLEQCVNVIKTAYFQKSFVKNGYPKVYGWVYDMRHGLIKDLNIDFKCILKKIQEIYCLE